MKFADGQYDTPIAFDKQVLGAKKFSYHLRVMLTEIITPRRLNFNIDNPELVVGGAALRIVFTPS